MPQLYSITNFIMEAKTTNPDQTAPSSSDLGPYYLQCRLPKHTSRKEKTFFVNGGDRRVAEIQIFEKTYLIVIKDETGLKFKMYDSTLFLIGSYAQKLVASY